MTLFTEEKYFWEKRFWRDRLPLKTSGLIVARWHNDLAKGASDFNSVPSRDLSDNAGPRRRLIDENVLIVGIKHLRSFCCFHDDNSFDRTQGFIRLTESAIDTNIKSSKTWNRVKNPRSRAFRKNELAVITWTTPWTRWFGWEKRKKKKRQSIYTLLHSSIQADVTMQIYIRGEYLFSLKLFNKYLLSLVLCIFYFIPSCIAFVLHSSTCIFPTGYFKESFLKLSILIISPSSFIKYKQLKRNNLRGSQSQIDRDECAVDAIILKRLVRSVQISLHMRMYLYKKVNKIRGCFSFSTWAGLETNWNEHWN